MQGTDGALGFDARRWTMTTEHEWRDIATQLACALESILDSPHYDYGLGVTDRDLEEAEIALKARLAAME